MKAQTLIKQWLSSPAHRLVCTLLVVGFGLGVLWWLMSGQPVQADPAFIYVRTDGSDTLCNGEYDADASAAPDCAVQTIGQGVFSVTVGGTVSVMAGTYPENVVVDKSLTLQGAGAGSTVIQGANTGQGIYLPNYTAGVTITALTVRNFRDGIVFGTYSHIITDVVISYVDVINNSRHGIFSNAARLTNIALSQVNASYNGTGGTVGRGLFFQSSGAVRNHVTIEDGNFSYNALVGIDFNIGQVTDVVITGNTVEHNGDAGIGVLGAFSALIDGNEVTDNGRFGIEIKNPDGDGTLTGPNRVVISNNVVSLTAPPTVDQRDHGGIVVIRRDVALGDGNPDIPSGVIVTGNSVSGFRQTLSDHEGFGIVIEGIEMQAVGNALQDNDVGLQIQAGNANYPGNSPTGSATAPAPDTTYFDRGNSSISDVFLNLNTFINNTYGILVHGNSSAEIVSSAIDATTTAIEISNDTITHTLSVTVTNNFIYNVGTGLSLTGAAPIQHVTLAGNTLGELTTVFDVATTGDFYAYANNIANFTTGIVDPGVTLNARHNWWGTYSVRPSGVNDDSWNYRLGALVEAWGMDTLGDAALTSAGGSGQGIIISHGYGPANAPFGQTTLPYGSMLCSGYYDYFVLNAAGVWTARVPLDTVVVGCDAQDLTLYRFALAGGGWPNTSCSGADCWQTPPGVIRNGDTLEVTLDAGTILQGTPFVASNGMANLVVSKTNFRTTVRPGETLAYLITITNTGNVPATVSVTDTLPTNSAFLVASDNGGEITTRVITWPEFTLPGNGARTTRLVVITVSDPLPAGVDTITNTVIATTPNEADETDNTAWDIDQINAAPDLALSKSNGGVTARPGETLVYTLTYANLGNQGATGVVITETIPAYTTFAGPADWDCASAPCTYDGGSLPAGVTRSITFAVTLDPALPAGVIQLVNTAGIADDGLNGDDTNPANNIASAVTPVSAAPDLEISKSGSPDPVAPGAPLTYQIVITNTGPQGATGVRITDYLPAHTAFSSASDGGGSSTPGIVTWPLFDLPGGGASVTRTLTITVTAPFPADTNVITNTVTVADDGANGIDPTPGNNSATLTTSVTAAPNLALRKSSDLLTVTPGSTLIYRLVITNTGNQLAAGIVLTDTLPEYTAFTLASHDGAVDSGIVAWPAFDLPGGGANATRLLVVGVDTPLPAGVTALTNTAALRDNRGFTATAQYTNPVNANPHFILTKTSAVTTTTPNATFSYTLTLTNTGNQAAANVVISDTLPADVAFVDASDDWYTTTPGIVVWQAINLPSGASVARGLTVTVNPTLPAGLEWLVNAAGVIDDRGYTATGQNAILVEATPDLVLTKRDDGVNAIPGALLAYTLTYTNTGPQGATGVVIAETVPAHTIFEAAASSPGWTCADGAPAGTLCECSIDDLPANASGNVDFTVRVVTPLPATAANIVNTASIADDGLNGTDPTPPNNTTTITSTVVAAPDLKISKSNGVDTVQPGDTLSYLITLTNTGNLEATNIHITDTLPLSTTLVAASDGGALSATGVVAWPTFNLPGGNASVTRLLVVSVNDPLLAGVTALTNTVAAIAPGQTTLTDTQDVDAVVAAPDLALSKSNGAVTVAPGATLVYTLTYANLGNQGATGVVITETVPANTTFDPAANHPDWNCIGATCTYAAGSLPGGATRSLTFTVNVDALLPAGVTQIVNTAGIADDGLNGADTNPANNTASTVTPVIATPDLTLTKSDGGVITAPGATLVYTLTYANIGNQEATGVVIAETVPANATFAGLTGWNCAGTSCQYNLGALPATASGNITFAVTIVNPLPAGVTQIDNAASIADDGSNGADPTPTNNTAATLTPVEATPDLEISKSNGVSTVQPGDTLTYQIVVTNTGNQNATSVRITDNIPAQTSFIAASDGGSQTTPGVVTWPAFALDGDGANVTRVLTVTVTDPFPADTNIITNTATVADDGTNGPDPTPTNNTAEDVDIVIAAPVLQLSKDNGMTTVVPGNTIIYRLIITNSGSQLAAGIVLTDTLPAHTTFYLASDEGQETAPGSDIVVWPTFNLPARSSITRLLVATVDNPLPADVVTITNTAALRDNRNNTAEAQDIDAVNANPLLFLDKNNAVESTVPGATLVYTLTLTNNGNQEATGILITDTLPADVTFVTASDGGYTTSPGIVAWPAFNLAGGGASVTRYLTVAVNPTLPAGVELLINTAQAIEDRGYTATAQHADLVVAAPDLAIAKTDGGSVPRPGEVLQYTLTYTNVGTQGATGVAVAETVPAYTTFDAATSSPGWTCADGALAGTSCTYTIGDLLAGDADTVVFAVRVGNPLPVYVRDTENTASIADDGNNGADTDPEDNSASVVTPFGATIDLLLTKDDGDITVEPGETIVYTLTYANNGDQIAGGVIITETVPVLTTFNQVASSTGWTCTHESPAGTTCTYALGDVIAGGTVHFAVDVVLPFPVTVSEITNQAVIGADANNIPDANPVDNTATATTPVITRPDLVVGKDDGFSVVLPEQQFTYVITVTNVGTQNATNVRITDTLPAYVAFTGASDGGTQSQPGVVTWPAIPQLGLDEIVTRTLSVMLDSILPAGVAHITNTVTVGDDGTHGLDLNPADNTTTDVNFVGAMPDLVLDKAVNYATIYPAGSLIYTIRVENTGSQGATGVSIVDILPSNTTFVSASNGGYQSAPGIVTWPAFALNVGEQAVRTLTVRTASGLPEGYVLTNTAAVSDDGTNGEDPTPDDNTDTASTTIKWPFIYLPLVLQNFAVGPDLIVEDVFIGNGTIAITITNQGQLVVTDTLGFWIDLYINPSPAPTHVNQTWDTISPYGAAWGVDREALPIEPGQSRTLYLYDIYYKPDWSRLPAALRAGDIVYVQVDSFNAATNYGAVQEDHEINGTTYNNIVRLIVDTLTPLNPVTAMQSAPVSPDADVLPERP